MVTGLKFELYAYNQFCNYCYAVESTLWWCHFLYVTILRNISFFLMENNHSNRVENGEPSYKIMFLLIKSGLQMNWILVNTPFSSFIPFMYLSKLNSCSLEFWCSFLGSGFWISDGSLVLKKTLHLSWRKPKMPYWFTSSCRPLWMLSRMRLVNWICLWSIRPSVVGKRIGSPISSDGSHW